MKIKIRQEITTDHAAVFEVIKRAFEKVAHSNQSEAFLVERLRQSTAFIPELSMVAVANNQVIGHILLTKIQIKNGRTSFDALALAPVSVLPEWQGQGIGGQLINKAHEVAATLEHQRIVLLGHAGYYPRFGYELLSTYGIELPFEAPDENCMVVALTTDALEGVSGKVVYDKAFFE